ncbi:MAG: type II toxin-antitoxin system VapC family toxin [bacterium]
MVSGRATLVDTNVLLDVLTQDPLWGAWSAERLKDASDAGLLAINPIIYAELSAGFTSMEILDELLGEDFERWTLPWEAGFLAGQCFKRYRRQGGQRRSPLPDFYIGAHAMVGGLTLLTRDAARYRSYFPKLPLLSPSFS